MSKKEVKSEIRPIKYVVLSQDMTTVIFKARTVGEAVAFIRGHQGGVLCRVLSPPGR